MDDRKSLVPIDFEEFDYVIAIQINIFEKNGESMTSFPPEVGGI